MRTIPTIRITAEQYAYALTLTELSATAHSATNIWDKQGRGGDTLKMRFMGLLGEVVFADLLHIARPAKAYGAEHGQDYGSDFCIKGTHVDIKTMRRAHGRLKANYVFNLAPAQTMRPDSKTAVYVFISVFGDIEGGGMYAQLAGKIERKTVLGFQHLCTVATAQRGDGTPIELASPVIAVPLSLMDNFKLPLSYAAVADFLNLQEIYKNVKQ